MTGRFTELTAARARLVFSGPDALRFVNGQVSNDARKLAPGNAIPACIMTAKGKLFAEAWLALDPAGIRIDAPAAVSAELLPRFDRYLIADDVEIRDTTTETAHFHLFDTASAPAASVRADRFGVPGWDIVVPANRANETRTALAASFSAASPADCDTLRIVRGVPAWGAELDPDTFPAEAGLDRTHVDFAKGCYLGQEIVSRMKMSGKMPRILVFLRSEPGDPGALIAGAALLDANRREIGSVTSAAPSSLALSGRAALGYVKRGSVTTGVVARAPSGLETRVFVSTPPYQL